MRVFFCLLALILFCGVYSWYLWLLTHSGVLSPHRLKLLYLYDLLGMSIFCFVDKSLISENPYHKQFNSICFYAIFINLLILIFYYHNLVSEPENLIYTFNGLVIAVSTMILISCKRHGYYN